VRLLRRAATSQTTTAAPEARLSASPRYSPAPLRNSSLTSCCVGTITIRDGAARHGPSAPTAVQFGNYDTFTRCGTPTADVRNDR
jgi:hypothetical protein